MEEDAAIDAEMVRLAKIVKQADYDEYVLRSDPEARQRMAAALLAEKVLNAWAARMDRAHRALALIAERHANDGRGNCVMCRDGLGNHVDFPCEDYLDATGQTP